MGRIHFALALALSLACLWPTTAEAFCGFYVASADGPLTNHTTSVVLLREGTLTVLSMQNDYHGPVEDFALVVPVPVVLRRQDVRTLRRDTFERIDALGAPRLVEYWEQDPCLYGGGEGTIGLGNLGTIGHGAGYGSGAGSFSSPVRVEAEFAVAEYDIVILAADEASALEDWLIAHHYRIPEGAAAALRPYVEEGMKFFVARVDADRVRFEEGRAVLSPLRFHYDSERFSLPVRLGLLSSDGTQDLIVNILARYRRFEVANYENVLIPTNLDVDGSVRSSFGTFYAGLFDEVSTRHPGAVVTEYAWGAQSCDPCPPSGSLEATDLAALGADVAFSGGVVTSTRAVPRVTFEVSRANGLSQEVFRRIVRRHINEARFCHEQSMVQEGTYDASVHVELRIDAGGSPVDVVEAEPRLAPAPRLVQCLLRAVARWTFPIPEPAPGDARFDFSFSAGGAEATTSPSEWVLSRLHYRYDRASLGEDLVFREAEAIVGGRELYDETGVLEPPGRATANPTFQARYAIRHPFEGPITCERPTRGIWGGPPGGVDASTAVATDIGAVARGPMVLASVIRSPVTDFTLPLTDAPPPPVAAPPPTLPPPAPPPPAATPTAAPAARVGCGCRGVVHGAEPLAAALALAFALLVRRR